MEDDRLLHLRHPRAVILAVAQHGIRSHPVSDRLLFSICGCRLQLQERQCDLQGSAANILSIIDMTGKNVFEGKVNNNVNLDFLPSGVYIVNINTIIGSYNKKIVLE